MTTRNVESAFLELVRAVQRAYGDVCFACGRENPEGLHVEPVGFEDGWVRARFAPGPHHVGAPPTLHGGIAATVIDEIMVWAGIATERVMSVTGKLDVRFRKSMRIDRPVTAFGRVIDRSGRRLRVEGRLEADDQTAVEGTGLYIVSSQLDHVLDGLET